MAIRSETFYNGDPFTLFFVATVAFLAVLLVIATLLWQLYRRFCFNPNCLSPSSSFHIPHRPSPAPDDCSLHPSLLELLPIFIFSAGEQSHPPPECVICLDAFEEGDVGRVLPNCGHFFHLECINAWLRKHKTCPLCRKVVDPPLKITSRNENENLRENSKNVNLPPPVWCPRNTWQPIQLTVVIETPEEDYRRRQRQSS